MLRGYCILPIGTNMTHGQEPRDNSDCKCQPQPQRKALPGHPGITLQMSLCFRAVLGTSVFSGAPSLFCPKGLELA
jgi:hypothetical protein